MNICSAMPTHMYTLSVSVCVCVNMTAELLMPVSNNNFA